MSQKSPERLDDETAAETPKAKAGDAVLREAMRGKQVVPRGIGLAGDTVHPAEPVVSYGEIEPLPAFEQDRETLPPPVPMEQLVEQMMQPDAELAGLEVMRPRPSGLSETIPPPASDVDTVRPRGDEPRTIPPLDDDTLPLGRYDAKTIPPTGDTDRPRPEEIATMPPPRDDADTLPPAKGPVVEEHEALYRGVSSRESPTSVTARAIDTAEAVFEELGVELFKGRSSAREDVPEEPPRTRPPEELLRPPVVDEGPRQPISPEPSNPAMVVEPPRTRPPEEPSRTRFPSSSRLTPPRTMRPADVPPPPPSSTTRPGVPRRRPSEPNASLRNDVPSVERTMPSSGVPVSERLNEVRERYEAADYRAALTAAEVILTDHPDHIAALGYAESSRQMLRQKYLGRIGDTGLAPRLKASAQELSRLNLDERAKIVVAAMDGAQSVDDLVGALGLSTLDVYRVLHDLLAAGAIELGPFSRGRR